MNGYKRGNSEHSEPGAVVLAVGKGWLLPMLLDAQAPTINDIQIYSDIHTVMIWGVP